MTEFYIEKMIDKEATVELEKYIPGSCWFPASFYDIRQYTMTKIYIQRLMKKVDCEILVRDKHYKLISLSAEEKIVNAVIGSDRWVLPFTILKNRAISEIRIPTWGISFVNWKLMEI